MGGKETADWGLNSFTTFHTVVRIVIVELSEGRNCIFQQTNAPSSCGARTDICTIEVLLQRKMYGYPTQMGEKYVYCSAYRNNSLSHYFIREIILQQMGILKE